MSVMTTGVVQGNLMSNVSQIWEIEEYIRGISEISPSAVWHCRLLSLQEFWTTGDMDKVPLFGKVFELLTCVLSGIIRNECVWKAMHREMSLQFPDHS